MSSFGNPQQFHCHQCKEQRRAIRELRKYLKQLVSACEQSITALDSEMEKPSTHERGGRVAKITNFLELNKDQAKRFGLGITAKAKRPRTTATEF